MVRVTHCPCCGGRHVEIAKMHCPDCGCVIEGSLDLTPFDTLDKPLYDLAALFIECDGNFKALGERLGMSQPTVRRRFNELKAAMGYGC